MDSIGRRWNQMRGQFSIREWFRKIIEAIEQLSVHSLRRPPELAVYSKNSKMRFVTLLERM
jgi:hypothetical protein